MLSGSGVFEKIAAAASVAVDESTRTTAASIVAKSAVAVAGSVGTAPGSAIGGAAVVAVPAKLVACCYKYDLSRGYSR